MSYRFSDIVLLGFLPALCLLGTACSAPAERDLANAGQPNVLLIFTDQQNIRMMSAMGHPDLQTPNMDRLARRGVLFTQAYCTSPVCGPARSSIIT